jgi:TIR domain
MDKETIFLSHSSRDSAVLGKLKDLLHAKTAETIDIFLSSDGESIRLGRNWVHRVEEALMKARIMLVFLSPNSINSHWVYFESGFAYSRSEDVVPKGEPYIDVVPVGILGVDLAQAGPPLSLLQGFNITSADGLNNIIALVNKTFLTKHAESFTEDEYVNVFQSGQLLAENPLGDFASLVESMVIHIRGDASKAFDDVFNALSAG